MTEAVTARRGELARRITYPLISVGILVVVLVAVELAVSLELLSPRLIPTPSAVLTAMIDGIESGVYWSHTASTLLSAAIGFLIAVLFGFGVAGLLTALPWLERIVYPYIVAFQSTPTIAIAPLIIIWLGFGFESKAAVVFVVCFFPILVNTLQGLRLRDRDRQELALALGMSRWQTFRFIRLPGSQPYVFAGLSVGAIFALLGAIVAEFVGSRDGLGVLLNQQRAIFNVPGAFAVLILLMVLGILINGAMKAVERKVIFWSQES